MSPGGASPRRRGDYHERQTRRHLAERDWLVVRAGGSLGIADLIAIKRGLPPVLVSCKLGGRISRKEREALIYAAQRYGAHAVIASRPKPGLIAWARVWPDDHDEPAHGPI